MLLDARTYPLLLTLSVCTPFVASQVVSGCPSYGCTPTGSFALLTSAGIPRSGVSVIWTTQISNSSGTGSPLLGCVSNNKHIVCPTQEGYVGLNSTTGSVIWRDNNLANPTLPIMDVTGDVIGTNGTFLMKIDSNGTTEQPVIPLVPPMHPVYSVVFGEGNIALLVSQTGELVAYLTNGTPLANLFLTGTVERYNGTFHPIAQPVMNGSRAYILTQFKPDPQYTQIPRDKLPGFLRLFAVDIQCNIRQRMRIAWNVSFSRNTTGCSNGMKEGEDVVLSYDGVVFISVAGLEQPETVVCESGGMFIAVLDSGTHGDVLYEQSRSLSFLAVYDDGFRRCHDVVDTSVIWLAAQQGSVVVGFDPQTGTTLRMLKMDDILNVKYFRISSRLMVKETDQGEFILVVGSKQSQDGVSYMSHVTALQVSTNYKSTGVLWNVVLPDDLVTEGQMSVAGDSSDVFVIMGCSSTGMYALGIK